MRAVLKFTAIDGSDVWVRHDAIGFIAHPAGNAPPEAKAAMVIHGSALLVRETPEEVVIAILDLIPGPGGLSG